jgi:protein translocase SecG subunit
MNTIVDYILIISSVLLIAVVLMQSKNAGMGAAFGGGSSIQQGKRGVEKHLFIATVILAVIFLATAFANAFLI